MAKEEINRLTHLFTQAAENQNISVEDLFREALLIFETLTLAIEKAPLERKQELLAEMREMHTLLSGEIARLCEALGQTEEEILSYSKDPSNFSPNQWDLIQAAKRNLEVAARKISKILVPSVMEKEPPTVPHSLVKKALPKSKKTGWMKS